MRDAYHCIALVVVLCLGLASSERRGVSQRTEPHVELFRHLSLSPPTSTSGQRALSPSDVDQLVSEFTQDKRRQGDLGVPSGITPVVIVPSLIGSRLEAQLENPRTAYWYCWTQWQEWFTIWLSIEELVPLMINCWYERMALHLDERSGRSYNTPGVRVRYMDYGGVDGVSYLDWEHYVGLWNTTVAILTSLGWTTGKDLRAAPYDWRFGPQTWSVEDWPRLRSLIEDTYAINNNSRVACVSLSMGGPYFLAFLNQQTQAWKDKYIHSYTSWDGAFGGSPSATSVLISSTGFWNQLFSNAEMLRATAQSWPSSTWMLPLAQVYGNQVWVSTIHPPRNYTTEDLAKLLIDAGGYNASKIYKILQANNWLTFDAPGVETHVFYGTGIPTVMRALYNSTKFDTLPELEFTDGDGTVPETGLRMLERWRGKQEKEIYHYPIPGLHHGGSPQNKQVLRMFLEVLSR